MKYGFVEDVSDIDFTLPGSPDFAKDLITPSKQNEIQFHIGSSVWADKDFKGHFYPEKTAQKNFLVEYAKQFKTVEVNATRYGTPRESTLETWRNNVPDDFKFSFKMPQIISVRKNLLDKDVLNRLEEFILAIDKMGQKAGKTFILLQNNFNHSRLKELEQFLSYLPQEQSFAVEIRNPQFNQSLELGQVLKNFNVSNVITDTAGERDVVHTLATGDSAFIRLVGNGLVETDYNRINDWVNQIKKWANGGVKNIYCLHHQPNANRRFAGYAAKYMIEQLNKSFPNSNIPVPTIYDAPSLF